jgi:hypothetical protein
LVVGVAAFRVATAIAFYLAGLYNAGIDAPLPPVAYVLLSLSFGALGLLLVVANRNDVRAAWLGGVLLLLAVPLTTRFLSQTPLAFGTLLARVEIGAFLPVFLWMFAREFPSRLEGRAGRIARAAAGAAAVFAVVAFAINLSIAVWPLETSGEWRRGLATGQGLPSRYWPALFLLSVAATAALMVRMLRSSADDRHRVRIFVGGLLLGLLPLSVEITVEEVWPAYAAFVHRPDVEPWVALALFGPLALIPFITAYSVMYDQVVSMRLVVRAAIQHALAKYTMLAGTLLPFAALGVYLFQYRAEPLTALLTGPRPVVLAAATAAGVVSLRARRRILHAIDRRFFREVYDANRLVTTIVSAHAMASGISSVAALLRSEIDHTLHARADLFVLDAEDGLLKDPEGERLSLSERAVLVSLACGSAQPMDVRLGGDSPLARLPDGDRAWLQAGGYELLLPIRSQQGALAGLLALTAKRSELPFSAMDCRSLSAIAPPLGLTIENERLRRSSGPTTVAGRECRMCHQVHAAGADRCSCGGPVDPAEVPHILRGVYRFDRRIGSGGMGVVYRATDLTLKRSVAIKTLPQLNPEHGAQLMREALAMASMSHPHLATIYGVESWRNTPLLVEEFMTAGTLLDRLRGGGPLAVRDVVRLGCSLTDVLAHLHHSGIVHCDIKPSNIGFTQGDVPKLLDFGVAYLFRDVGDALASTVTALADDSRPLMTRITERGILGTPPYMPPEAASGAAPTPLFDLWSLSVALFEALTGERPFAGRRLDEVMLSIAAGERRELRRLRPDCPPAFAVFFDQALAVDIRQRPQTAGELKARLSMLQSVGL